MPEADPIAALLEALDRDGYVPLEWDLAWTERGGRALDMAWAASRDAVAMLRLLARRPPIDRESFALCRVAGVRSSGWSDARGFYDEVRIAFVDGGETRLAGESAATAAEALRRVVRQAPALREFGGLRADGISELVGSLQANRSLPLEWAVRHADGGRDPVAGAWARAWEPIAIVSLLEFALTRGWSCDLRRLTLEKRNGRDARIAIPRLRADEHPYRAAERVRAAVPTPPTLGHIAALARAVPVHWIGRGDMEWHGPVAIGS